jgi:hypothetical protein
MKSNAGVAGNDVQHVRVPTLQAQIDAKREKTTLEMPLVEMA